MNIEVEIKVRVNRLDVIKDILQKTCAFVEEVWQKDSYYVLPEQDFFAEEPVTKFFRVREQDGKHQLAFHEAKLRGENSEYNEEYEVVIGNPTVMKDILEKLGFQQRFVIEKHREYWHCDNFEIVVDSVTNLGHFIEVEVRAHTNQTQEDCERFLAEKGIPFIERVKLSYPELMKGTIQKVSDI